MCLVHFTTFSERRMTSGALLLCLLKCWNLRASPLQAVCCADHEHCCPQGYTCNMQTGTCEKKSGGALALPQSEVALPEPRGGEDVPCDATGGFHCPERDTCCKISTSEWACCPSPKVRSHSHTKLHVWSSSCRKYWFDSFEFGWCVTFKAKDPKQPCFLPCWTCHVPFSIFFCSIILSHVRAVCCIIILIDYIMKMEMSHELNQL